MEKDLEMVEKALKALMVSIIMSTMDEKNGTRLNLLIRTAAAFDKEHNNIFELKGVIDGARTRIAHFSEQNMGEDPPLETVKTVLCDVLDIFSKAYGALSKAVKNLDPMKVDI